MGLIDPAPGRGISYPFSYRILLPGLDLSRCVEGGPVSNLPLDFRQYSFTHIIQVSKL